MLKFDTYKDHLAVALHLKENTQSISSLCVWNYVMGKAREYEAFIIRDDSGDPYLLRVYLTGSSGEGKTRKVPRAYLHFFFRGDSDRELHSHPWETFMQFWPFNLFGSLSLILTGGYVEERLTKTGQVRIRKYRPGMLNILQGKTFHRVRLNHGGTWTLFLAGRRSQLPKGEDWGFLDLMTGAYETYNEREVRLDRERQARVPNITPFDPKAFDAFELPGAGVDPFELD